jgi:hypothetical protein
MPTTSALAALIWRYRLITTPLKEGLKNDLQLHWRSIKVGKSHQYWEFDAASPESG